MKKRSFKKPLILGLLFFLPVLFLLFLYPSSHNYNALDIVKENVLDISGFDKSSEIQLEGNLTVIGFLGIKPIENTIMALNLKELIYDKFKGFKRFQVLMLVSEDTQEQIKLLKKELYQHDELKYWHFVYANENQIKKVYNSLSSKQGLDVNLSTNNVFIIDKDLNQRGRLDDRTDREKEKNTPVYGLNSYNCIQIAEIKNKMGDDMRILFTEYRQKRKGKFDSTTRRADDLKK
ncbi:MAG: hypothetical protein DRI75_00120 [Bacteroidetes bacterium]|nr:MAG: hypothetical protein DRI75_00120 [Bacteroidota bacterium]